MKNRIILLLIICLAVFSTAMFAQTPPLLARTIVKTDKFDFRAGGTLTITGAPNGSIRVIGTGKNEIEITAEIKIQAQNESDLNRLAEGTGFVTDDSAIRASIITVGGHNKFGLKKLPKGFPKNLADMPFRVDYVISVPHYCDLEIDGGKGDLSINGVEGSMRINFLETNAKIDVIAGELTMTAGSGTVDLALGVLGWRGRAANIQVATGNLKVRLPSNMSAEIDATILHTGSIENALPDLKPRDRKVPFTDKSIIAKAGPGGPRLKFTVGDGKIKIEPLVPPL